MIRKNGGKETETEYFAALVRVLWDRINKISRISLVYCCKGCNLIGYSARYLFFIRWRILKQSFSLKRRIKSICSQSRFP